MTAFKAFVLAAGIVVLVVDFWDLLRSLVVPRPWGHGPIVMVVRALRQFCRLATEKITDFDRRDRILAILEPLMLLLRLGIWLLTAVIGFGLVIWSTESPSIEDAFVRSGSDIFTLCKRYREAVARFREYLAHGEVPPDVREKLIAVQSAEE